MEPVYGQPPIIGFTVPIDSLRVDYELYKTLFQASNNGKTMSTQQQNRYHDLKQIFEPQT